MDFINEMEKMIPASFDAGINWNNIEKSGFEFFIYKMKCTPQNPEFHGEGDVYTHIQMVCDELIKMPVFWKLGKTQKVGLFTAALLHDVGKIRTTKEDDGKWVSPHHLNTGSLMVREFLWQICGLCGSDEKIQLRELICTLVRYHMLPVHLIDQENPERKVREVAVVYSTCPQW